MKRSGVVVAFLVLVALAMADPALARDPEPCSSSACGAPNCWGYGSVSVRPERARRASWQCLDTVSARLVRGPEHGTVTDISTDWSRLRFTVLMDGDAPPTDEVVFEVQGHARKIELKVPLEVVPVSENSPPNCYGDTVTKRSDGTGPVDIFAHPNCIDPDGDEFTMYGGGPGVHRESPKQIPAGENDPNWNYRTATFSGEETTPIWAIDSLGARSADAQLKVTVGPAVDLPPECRPNPAMWPVPFPVYSRPGKIRRFAVICEDVDFDSFEPSLTTPPSRGVLTYDIGTPMDWGGGRQRWVDATYVPTGADLEPDPFGWTATSARGAGPEAKMEIVPRPLPANSGGGCGWSPALILVDTPSTIDVSCDDDDGDPLQVKIVTEPEHGVATPPVLTPAKYGGTKISVPYVPTPGYVGYDCIEIEVSDGNGLGFTLSLDISVVKELPSWMLPWVPPPAPPPLPLPVPIPGQGTGRPANAPVILSSSPSDARRIRATRATARAALGTTAVKRIKAAPGFDIWARTSLSKRDLTRHGTAPGVVAVCVSSCDLRFSSALRGSKTSARRSRRQTVVAAQPGEARVATLVLSKGELRTLKKTRRPAGTFEIRVKPASGATVKVSRDIPVR